MELMVILSLGAIFTAVRAGSGGDCLTNYILNWSILNIYICICIYTNNINYLIIFTVDCGIMQAEKKVPPKPQGLKKKEERNQKISTTLKELREKRRAENKTKR